MIIINPADYNKEETISFFKQWASNLGFNTGRPSITPYSVNGDFQVQNTGPGTSDQYIDISNLAAGNQPQATITNNKMNTILLGDLELTTYIQLDAGTTCTFTQWLVTGPPVNLTHFLISQRTAIASQDAFIEALDTVLAQPVPKISHARSFKEIPVNFIRIKSTQTGANNTFVICEFLFSGIRIDF